jgi:ADP-heptose:LPS heptosyltransferase
VSFVNLQHGECAGELEVLRTTRGMTVHDWPDSDPLKDLDDFAAKIAALDLVISIDNSTVHLAGALGQRVWTLLPSVPEWRWMLDRDDTPWYPTMRLFRQTQAGRWSDVMERVAKDLRSLA